MSELPPGWEWTTLGELAALVRGVSFKRQEVSSEPADGLVPIIRAGNVQSGQLDLDHDLVWVPETRVSPDQYLRSSDIVVATSSGSLSVVGKSARVHSDWIGAHGAFMAVVRPRGVVQQSLLYWWLQTETVRRSWSAASAGTNINNLKVGTLTSTPVPLPPMPEQERIVAAIEEHLSRLDAAAASLRSAETRLGTLESRSADEAFRSLGERVPVGELADVRGGIQKQPKRKPKNDPAPFLRVANVGHGWLNLDEVHQIELFDGELERCRLEPGDLLVVEGNGSPDQIGRSAVWHGEIDPCVHQNHLIRVRPGPRLDPEFLGLYWNAPSTRAQLTAVASSTSGLHTLSTAKVKRVEVPVAPIDQQTTVVAQLAAQNVAFEHLRASVRVASARQSTLRRAVLAAAFSGQLVPQDPDDEPASVLLERIRAERTVAAPTKRTRKVKAS